MSEELRVEWKYWTVRPVVFRTEHKTAYAPTPCPEQAADYIYRTTGEHPSWMMDESGNEWDMTRNAFGQEIRPTQAVTT